LMSSSVESQRSLSLAVRNPGRPTFSPSSAIGGRESDQLASHPGCFRALRDQGA
jgi:hypothetical protein